MDFYRGFKPQRGKFTPYAPVLKPFVSGFKPQRGKFTLMTECRYDLICDVSNPNGVNLHEDKDYGTAFIKEFQTPTG